MALGPARRYVPVANKAAGSRVIQVEDGATVGAVVGVNLFNADGSLVKLYVPPPDDDGFGFTYWKLIQEIPPNVVALAETSTTGLYAITGDGTSATREIELVDGELVGSNLDGVAGNPSVGLADVADAGGGTLQKTAFDAKGRKTGTSDATTDDLPEGASNLYFTDARAADVADARISAAKADPDGIASLQDGKLDPGQLPALAITETFVVNTEAAMLALDCEQGDVAVRTDLNKSFILTTEPASTLANWQDLLTPTSPVTSVHGRTGAVVAASGDYTFAQIGSKPTTLAGYGITDAATAAQGAAADTAVQPGDLASVATSGDYNDLANLPTLGTAAAADAGDFATAAQGAKADSAVQPGDLSAVATSGDYSDLSGLPTLGTAAAADAGDFDAAGSAAAALSAAGAYADTKVAATITDGDTTHAPSGGAVFGALATKANDSEVIHATGDENIGGRKTFTTGIVIAAGPATGRFSISSEPGQIAEISIESDGVPRWAFRGTNAPETGGNAGTNLRLQAKADDGSQLFNIFEVTRSTGVLNFLVRPTVSDSPVVDRNDMANAGLMTVSPTVTDLDAMIGSTARFFRAVAGATGLPAAVSGAGGVGYFIPYSAIIASQFWHATTSNRLFMRGYNGGWNAWKEITAA